MGQPAVDFSSQSLVKAGFKPEQADVLLRLMDLKMQNLLTQDYLDAALGRFADKVSRDISDLRTEVKQEIAGLRTEIKDLRTELKADIKDVRHESALGFAAVDGEIVKVRSEIEKVRVDIADRQNKQLVWMFGIICGSVGLTLTAIKLFFF